MKKLIAMLLALVMLLALCACGQTAAPAEQPAAPAEEPAAEPVEEPTDDVGEPVNLIFSIAAVPTDAHGAAQKVFKETLESISGGNMTVECYDSGTLYGQDTEHDALKNGDVDMIYSSASWLTDGSPWISMFTAGYVFQSYDHMTKVLNGDIGKDMFQKVAEEQGILPLGAFYLGTRQISLSQDKQIKTPEDLKGINLRMPNSDRGCSSARPWARTRPPLASTISISLSRPAPLTARTIPCPPSSPPSSTKCRNPSP